MWLGHLVTSTPDWPKPIVMMQWTLCSLQMGEHSELWTGSSLDCAMMKPRFFNISSDTKKSFSFLLLSLTSFSFVLHGNEVWNEVGIAEEMLRGGCAPCRGCSLGCCRQGLCFRSHSQADVQQLRAAGAVHFGAEGLWPPVGVVGWGRAVSSSSVAGSR